MATDRCGGGLDEPAGLKGTRGLREQHLTMKKHSVISLYSADDNAFFHPFTINTVNKLTSKPGRAALLAALPADLSARLKEYHTDIDAYGSQVLPAADDLRQKVLEIITKHRLTLLSVDKRLADAAAELRARNAANKKAARVSLYRAEMVVRQTANQDFKRKLEEVKRALVQQPPNIADAMRGLTDLGQLVDKYLD